MTWFWDDITDVVLVFLFLTLNIFHTSFYFFYEYVFVWYDDVTTKFHVERFTHLVTDYTSHSLLKNLYSIYKFILKNKCLVSTVL